VVDTTGTVIGTIATGIHHSAQTAATSTRMQQCAGLLQTNRLITVATEVVTDTFVRAVKFGGF
jgi:hypothetical protein